MEAVLRNIERGLAAFIIALGFNFCNSSFLRLHLHKLVEFLLVIGVYCIGSGDDTTEKKSCKFHTY
jgi:hypothetical protein